MGSLLLEPAQPLVQPQVTETSGSLQALLGPAKQQEQLEVEAVLAQRQPQVVPRERAQLLPLAHQP